MTSQQDTELEKILIRYRSTADAAWSEVKDGFYTQEEYEVALRKISDEAIQALTSWKDKEVKKAIEIHDLENAVERLDVQCSEGKCKNCDSKRPRLKEIQDRLESLQSQGGKNE